MLRKLIIGCAAVMALSGAAQAVPIVANSNFTVDFALPGIGGRPPVTATLNFSGFVFNANQMTFNLSVANTTSPSGNPAYVNARFTAFGFDTAPNATAASYTGSIYNTSIQTTLAGTSVDVCVYGGPNCNGGGNGGLDIGQTTAFSSTYTFGQTLTSNDFTGFFAKFQTNAGSIEGAGTVRTTVPEPLSLGLLGIGLAGVGLVRLRARHRSVLRTAVIR